MIRSLISLAIIFVLTSAAIFVLASFSGISLSDLPRSYLERLKYVGIEEVDKREFKVVKLKVAVMGDSHNDKDNLKKALKLAKSEETDFVIFLGDLTQVGSLKKLREMKEILDESDLEYYAIPGDHDLWKSVGPQNFINVFGKNYQAFYKEGILFVLIDNSDNYNGTEVEQLVWVDNLLKRQVGKEESVSLKRNPLLYDELKESNSGPVFTFLSTPLYHYSSPRIFGNNPKTFEEIKDVAVQRETLLALFRLAGVRAVFAGDFHFSERYNDLKKVDMMHFVVGALTDSRNLQTPRFSILTIYDDNSYEVEDIVL